MTRIPAWPASTARVTFCCRTVTLLERPGGEPFTAFRRDPIDTRSLFVARGWRRVVGFQTRNPVASRAIHSESGARDL